jgi:peptide/nickel transport system ATP-binding protein
VTTLVACEEVVRTYGGLRAVDGVSLGVERGETFGLVGESGSGKSTLAALLLGIERPTAGCVRFDGRDLAQLPRRELRAMRQRMQMVFQDPAGALNRRKTVEHSIGLPLLVHRKASAAERRRRVHELLDLVGLAPAHAQRFPRELSGGQCQRVGIARAIALEPELVVLDEAVSAVDVSVQAQILNLLRDLQGRLGLTYLFVSHDLAVVRYMAPRVAVMHRGRVVETGTREDVFGAPSHEYTRALMAAVPLPDPDRPRLEPAA